MIINMIFERNFLRSTVSTDILQQNKTIISRVSIPLTPLKLTVFSKWWNNLISFILMGWSLN